MKKFNKILLLLVFLFGVIMLSGCSFNQMFCKHEFVETEQMPTCTEEGFKKKTCSKCGLELITILPKTDHDFSSWVRTKEPTSSEDGLEERTCKVCGAKETKVIQFVSFLDTSILELDVNFDNTYSFDSIEKLQVYFDSAMFNNSTSLKVKLNFECSDFQELLNTLINNSNIKKDIKIGMKQLGSDIEFTFEYQNIEPSEHASSTDKYLQYNSLNLTNITKTRSDTFDDFKINHKKNTYNVATSEQLVYVVERGYKPIIKENTNAFRIYNEAKRILRNIINDDMSSSEKVKAIHDYIIMNVVYDDDLLNLGYTNPKDIRKYNGFYLEGVFFDKRAVCDGISKAISLLCNMEGIPCIQITGKNKNNPNGMGHAWNKVYVDNNWYILDATSDGAIVNGQYEILSYEYFLTKSSKMEETYLGDIYNNISCNNSYNIFKDMKYTFNNNEYDLDINNIDELKPLIQYLNSLETTNNYTIQIIKNYDSGKSFEEDISNICLSLNIQFKYSIIKNDNIITIIKGGTK